MDLTSLLIISLLSALLAHSADGVASKIRLRRATKYACFIRILMLFSSNSKSPHLPRAPTTDKAVGFQLKVLQRCLAARFLRATQRAGLPCGTASRFSRAPKRVTFHLSPCLRGRILVGRTPDQCVLDRFGRLWSIFLLPGGWNARCLPI